MDRYHTLFFILCSCFLLLLFSCEKPTEPPDKRGKDPRTYDWTADTIAYPGSFQTAMRDIWGSSPSNVYIVGFNSSGPGTMFRFDGKQWKTTGFHAAEGGPISGAISLWGLHGFGENDIWFVGERIYQNPTPPPNFLDSSLIIHFDGTRWTEHKVQGRQRLAVWGIAPNDVWIGSSISDGTMLHYDGTSWSKMTLPQATSIYDITGFGSNDVYALGGVLDSVYLATFQIFHWDGRTWTLIDSTKQQAASPSDFGGGGILAVGGQLFSVGSGMFKKQTASWQFLGWDVSSFFTDVYGVSPTSLFVTGSYGGVFHFNGKDLHKYNQLISNNIHFFGVWANGEEVFVVGETGGGFKSVVLHGK